MDDIRHPTQFLYRFKHTAGVENSAFNIVNIFFTLFINKHCAFVEIVIIVNEIYLHASSLNACHLDDEWVVCIINNNIHSRQTNNFVQLIASLVNDTPSWHKCANLVAIFLNELGESASHERHTAFWNIRCDFLGNE